MATEMRLDKERIQSLIDSNKLVIVECFLKKPCWFLLIKLWSLKNWVKSEAIMLSRILQQVDVSAVGR